MTHKSIFLGKNKADFMTHEVKGAMINFENEAYYKIENSNEMRPFFMSIVSDSNHWMFISSNGGLTAGRKNSEFSLFPYYTDDKITESADITGSKAIFQVLKNGIICGNLFLIDKLVYTKLNRTYIKTPTETRWFLKKLMKI